MQFDFVRSNSTCCGISLFGIWIYKFFYQFILLLSAMLILFSLDFNLGQIPRASSFQARPWIYIINQFCSTLCTAGSHRSCGMRMPIIYSTCFRLLLREVIISVSKSPESPIPNPHMIYIYIYISSIMKPTKT